MKKGSRNEDAKQPEWTRYKSLLYAKLTFGSLIDNIADTDCRQNFEKIGSYATIEASKTISLHNTPSQPDESMLRIIRCYTKSAVLTSYNKGIPEIIYSNITAKTKRKITTNKYKNDLTKI